jgi:predicted nuclease of predicted toxin-antitoxin system
MINTLTRNAIEIVTSQQAIADLTQYTGHPLTWLRIGNIALYAVVLVVVGYVVLKYLDEKRG